MKAEEKQAVRERFAMPVIDEAPGPTTIGSGWGVPKSLVEGSEFTWFHPPTSGELFLAVLSAEPLWYAGHYYRGRMRPCQGDRCEMCTMQVGRQVRYVLSAVDLNSRSRGLVEFGSRQGEMLAEEAERKGSLRGVVITLGRRARRKNAAIEVCVIHEPCPGWVDDIGPLPVDAACFQTWSRLRVSDGS